MSYPVTHVSIVDNFDQMPQKMVLGYIRDISPRREEKEDDLVHITDDEEDLERWEDDGGAEEETKVAKVVRPRRAPRPKSAKVAETK